MVVERKFTVRLKDFVYKDFFTAVIDAMAYDSKGFEEEYGLIYLDEGEFGEKYITDCSGGEGELRRVTRPITHFLHHRSGASVVIRSNQENLPDSVQIVGNNDVIEEVGSSIKQFVHNCRFTLEEISEQEAVIKT